MGVSADLNNISALTTTGAFFSSDGGNTWQKSTIASGEIAMSICRNGSILFAGMDYYNNGIVEKSTNNGQSWTQCLSLGETVLAVALHNTTIFAGTFDGFIWKSTDNGISWKQVLSINNNIGSLYYDGASIVAGCSNIIYRSTDNGNTWEQSLSSISGTVRRLLMRGGTLYAAAGTDMYASIYISNDGGQTWNLRCSQIGGVGYVSQIYGLVNRDSLLLLGSGSGLFSSTDNGTTWKLFNQGISQSSVSSFVSLGARLFAATDNCGVMFTDDNGQTWNQSASGIPQFWPYSLCAYKSFLFAVGGPDKLYASSDSGKTWSSCLKGLAGKNAICLAASGDSLFLGTDAGIFISKDTASTWNQPNPGLSNRINNVFAINNLLFVTSNVGSYRSIDGGSHWSSLYVPAFDSFISGMAQGGQFLFAMVSGLYGLYRSEDNGADWSSLGFEGIDVTCVMTISNWVFVGTMDYGVLVSQDHGTTWYTMNDGLISSNIDDFAVHQNILFASLFLCGAQSFPLGLLGITSVRPLALMPNRISLKQNYPNPFNPTTTISFALPSRSFVSLKVFDMLGREVATIVSEEMAAGNYSKQWNAAKMSSGVYIYRLQVGSFTETKKLVLLR
jgi:photosystem II stability/assembly factor-like uncharacterized protein